MSGQEVQSYWQLIVTTEFIKHTKLEWKKSGCVYDIEVDYIQMFSIYVFFSVPSNLLNTLVSHVSITAQAWFVVHTLEQVIFNCSLLVIKAGNEINIRLIVKH